MISTVLAAVLPVLLTALIGFVWVRSGRSIEASVMTPLVADIGTPCLVFATLSKAVIPPWAFAEMAAATALSLLTFVAVGMVILKATGLKIRTYLPALSFPNTGNLGLPLSLYAFGQSGLSYAIAFFSIASVANYTIGQAIAAGRADWRFMIRMPLLHAVWLGIVVALFRIELPLWLGNTVSLLGGLTIPIMLLMLGSSLARLRVAAFPRAVAISALRLSMGAAVGFAVAALFGLEGTARAVLIMQCAMPVAVYSYLFAQRWNNEPEEVAGLVVVSTLASVATIPTLLTLLL